MVGRVQQLANRKRVCAAWKKTVASLEKELASMARKPNDILFPMARMWTWESYVARKGLANVRKSLLPTKAIYYRTLRGTAIAAASKRLNMNLARTRQHMIRLCGASEAVPRRASRKKRAKPTKRVKKRGVTRKKLSAYQKHMQKWIPKVGFKKAVQKWSS